jgi:hypothetical protein
VIRERTIAWSDPKLTAGASRGMAGLDFLRGMRDGGLPAAPIAALAGVPPPRRRKTAPSCA